MIPDRFNPRVWLRNWLLKPTAEEASLGRDLPNPMATTVNHFTVVNTHAQGNPVAQPFGAVGGQVALDPDVVNEAFAKNINQWAERESRPGGVLHGRGPDASWTLRKDGNFKIQGMGPSEGQTDEPV